MNTASKKISIISSVKNEAPSSLLSQRISRDLIIALMGPVGSGLPAISTELQEKLQAKGYIVHRIKISDFIKTCIENSTVDIDDDGEKHRYIKYQTAGNKLREKFNTEILAEYAINQIGRHRQSLLKKQSDAGQIRLAFLIDQIKHQDELKLLRLVYRNNLYALGVMSLQEQREHRLMEEGITKQDSQSIISRDKKESDSWGQQLEKTFKLADYFLQNPFGKMDFVSKQIERFISLVHGSNKITPTTQEHSMYVAYTAAAKSACLSRQVGASICDDSGKIIAIGTNDVPKSGGGLYSADDVEDYRCFNKNICENDREKNERLEKIKNAIKIKINSLSKEMPEEHSQIIQKQDWASILFETVKESSGIKDLIEFSRAVHAEMDALISITRTGGVSTKNGTLYTTTFPCHNCARHIIASGIKKVYYIEPYAKSLALKSHSDDITVYDFENDASQEQTNKVMFIHFTGVAPRAFTSLFSRDEGRKNSSGTFIEFNDCTNELPEKMVKEYRDSYIDFELKVAAVFDSEFSGKNHTLDI
ncbi:anti-phage dCTP deaminase [Chromobacterium sp. Panama]|uniref:anti-phage dCTP deaminase n=1 Tax=Chromobacterium sp. Panama TaxID=2161826 RepID=UPI001304CB6A|nr:anti-phage dCTP deaminase [Chromobacterium sp. Panama]